MIHLVWERFKQYREHVLVTFFNKYQGLILFVMLLAIWYK